MTKLEQTREDYFKSVAELDTSLQQLNDVLKEFYEGLKELNAGLQKAQASFGEIIDYLK